jgi:hypothetical protein
MRVTCDRVVAAQNTVRARHFGNGEGGGGGVEGYRLQQKVTIKAGGAREAGTGREDRRIAVQSNFYKPVQGQWLLPSRLSQFVALPANDRFGQFRTFQ